MSLYQVASRFLVARYVAHSPDDIISIHPKAQGVRLAFEYFGQDVGRRVLSRRDGRVDERREALADLEHAAAYRDDPE